jgi:HD domain
MRMTHLVSPSESRLALPDSDIASAARQFVYDVSPQLVAHHCVRSYLFARELAAAKGLHRDVHYDDELVFLACMLHDLGATDHGNGDQRFEVDGADAAARFLSERGVPEARVSTVWQAIALHTSTGLAHKFGLVQGVAQMGVSADMIGVGREVLPPGFADQVHALWPRGDVGYSLPRIIARQVEENPAKGPPLSFPHHVHQLLCPTATPLTWFDLIRNAGWNDQP